VGAVFRDELVSAGVVSSNWQPPDPVVISKYPLPESTPSPGWAVLAVGVERLPAAPATIADGLTHLKGVRRKTQKTGLAGPF
jgi:hypothetical protein